MLSTALYWEHNQGKPLSYYISLVSKKDKKADGTKMELKDGIFRFDTANIWKPLYKEGNCCTKCSGEMQLNDRQESCEQHKKGWRLKKTLHFTQNLTQWQEVEKGQSCCVKPSGFLTWQSTNSATTEWAGSKGQGGVGQFWAWQTDSAWLIHGNNRNGCPLLPCLNLFIAPISWVRHPSAPGSKLLRPWSTFQHGRQQLTTSFRLHHPPA